MSEQKPSQTFKKRRDNLKNDVEDLWTRAYHDSLTGLLNRAALEDTLIDQLQLLYENPENAFALLFMDLNGFKAVNDEHSHEVGDELLKEVAQRLRKSYPDMSFRLGGDEFVVLVPKCNDSDKAMSHAEAIRSKLTLPYVATKGQHSIAPSIGVVFCDDRKKYDADNASAGRVIIREADDTMYAAKQLSKTSVFIRLPHVKQQLHGLCLLSNQGIRPTKFEFPRFQNPSRNGFGIGRLIADKTGLDCDFEFFQSSDGEIQIFVRSYMSLISPNQSELDAVKYIAGNNSIEFEGQVHVPEFGSNCVVSSKETQAIEIRQDSIGSGGMLNFYLRPTKKVNLIFQAGLVKKVRFYIANMDFPTDTFDSDKPIQIEPLPFPILLTRIGTKKEHANTLEKLGKAGGVEVTCCADIEITSMSQIDEVTDTMNKVCDLLSLLHGSRVDWLSYDLIGADNRVISSECAHRIIGRFCEPNFNGIWTFTNLEHSIPKMFANLPLVEDKWNLRRAMNILSKSISNDAFLEMKGCIIIQCLSMLMHAYRQQKSEQELPQTMLTTNEFVLTLIEMCKALNLKPLELGDGDSTEDERLTRIVKEIGILRDSLNTQGTLYLNQVEPTDTEYRRRWNFERWRRVNALYAFTQTFLGAILDPEGYRIICPSHIEGFNNISGEGERH